MRILIFAPNYLPATRYGGPVRSTHGLARALVQLGHEVTVLTTNVDGPNLLDVPHNRPVDVDGVLVHYCVIKAPRRIYYSPQIKQLAEKLIPKIDIVHINGMFLWPGPYIARTARKFSKPVVISPRGMLMPEMVAGKSRWAKMLWIRFMERTELAAAQAIHVTSKGEALGLQEMGLDIAKVVIVSNGVDLPARAPSESEINKIWGDVPQGQRVSFLARLDWTKGLDLAIEAVRLHPKAILLIGGHDQIGMRSHFEQNLCRSDGSICGVFLGPLDGMSKWSLLAGADVLLAPSVSESFGMSVAEALAVGTPVITTPGVGAKTIVEEIDAECIVERNTEALAQALVEQLASPSRRLRFSEKARTLMVEKYAWVNIAKQMTEVYSETVKNSKLGEHS